jgi:hypothetical protein
MQGTIMNGRILLIFVLLLSAMPAGARAVDRMQFWNLTGATITKLYLAPAGTTRWGPDQCTNDKDGTVDPDERLSLTGLIAGRYDVKLTDGTGRTCVVKDVAVEAGKAYAFSLSDSDLKECSK